jgi:predicted RNase H-like HicB family nuclease
MESNKKGRVNVSKKYEHYSMVIQWSVPDHTYIVTVRELPGCKTHGDTYEEAVRNGQEVIELWIEASREWGHSIPPPRVLLAS